MVKVIKCAEVDKRKNSVYENFIDKQKQRIDILGRKAYSYRYRLSSNATLTNLYMYPRYLTITSLHIWAKVENESFDNTKYFECHNLFIQKYLNIEITGHELFNEIFEPFEQFSEIQALLLGVTFEVLVGGLEESSSGLSSGMPWE